MVVVVADSDETTTSSDFVSNWSSSGDIWKKISDGSGTPGLNTGTLVKTSAGSSVMLFVYAVIGTIRSGATAISDLVTNAFDFLSDLVSVLYGGGAVVPSGAGGTVSVSGPADYASSVFESAASTLSSRATGFLLAVGLVFLVATLVWGVRRYVL